MKKVLAAALFAAEKHAADRRKGARSDPYINHPLGVAEILARVGGIADEDLLAAAMLHDTLEDTNVTPQELRERFGDRVLGYVQEVTDDKTLTKPEQIAALLARAPSMSPGAKCLKLADQSQNLESLISDPPKAWSPEKCQAYVAKTARIGDALSGVNPALEALLRETRQHALALVIAQADERTVS